MWFHVAHIHHKMSESHIWGIFLVHSSHMREKRMEGCISYYVLSHHSFLGKKKSLIPKELFYQLYGNNETDTALENLYKMTAKILDKAILRSQRFSVMLSPGSLLSDKKCISKRRHEVYLF